jgi:protease II
MLRRILKGIKKHNSLLPRPPPPLDRQKSLIKYHFNHNSDYCERIDEYAYLSSVSRLANDYIKLENEYTESYFHRQQPLIDRLMSELKQWQQTDCGEYLTGERGKDGRYYFQSDGVYFSAGTMPCY